MVVVGRLAVDEGLLLGLGGLAHRGELVGGVEGWVSEAGLDEFLEVGVVVVAALGLMEGADVAGIASEPWAVGSGGVVTRR